MGPELLKKIVDELGEVVTGGLISKIDQPGDRDLVLKIFLRGKTRWLIISTDPDFSRLHLTGKKHTNPKTPKRFCSFLRSRILNAAITSVVQRTGERIVDFKLEKKAAGKVSSFILRAELTGKSSNIILLDSDNVVLDALRYFQPHVSARAVTPGVILEELPPKKTAAGPERLPEKPEGATWNGFIDSYYSGIIEKGRFRAEEKRLTQVIKKAEKKTGRKLKNLYSDKKRSEENLGAVRFGQLLVSNLAAAKRGMKEAALTDYTKIPPEEVRVPLDEKLTPAENAERFFKRSKKARTALRLLKERIPSVQGDLEYINSLMYELERAASVEDLAVLTEELIKGGYIKKAPATAKGKKTVKAEPVMRYTSREGFPVFLGRSATGNDIIVKKYAGPGDIWLHAKGVPGSHVLIKAVGKNKPPTEKAVAEAASLAAINSRAGGAKKAEVIFTDARNVKKPRGARPGMVTVKEYKTIVVKPEDLFKGGA